MITDFPGAADSLPSRGTGRCARFGAAVAVLIVFLVLALGQWSSGAAGLSLTGWGHNYYGQATPPAAATNLVAVSAGWQHSLALRADGLLVPWGWTNFDLPKIPSGASNIVAMFAGVHHDLALRADGKVFAWGENDVGQTNVPTDLTNVVAVTAGIQHSVALLADGTVRAWGDNTFHQLNIPAAATNIVAIGAGLDYTLGLKSDGSLVGWGTLVSTDIEIPTNATDVATFAAGPLDCLVLRSDGGLVAWGRNLFGESDIPTNAVNVTAVAAGELFSLATRQDGKVLGWGDNYYGQSTAPEYVTNPIAIYAGDDFSLAWLPNPSDGVKPQIWKQPAAGNVTGGSTLFLHPGINGTPPLSYQWYFNNAPMPGQTNGWLALTNANPTQSGSYRVIVTNSFGGVTSAVAAFTVPAIQILAQPSGTNVVMNKSLTLSAIVAGTAPLSVRWQKNGQDLTDTNRVSGLSSTILTIANTEPGDTGEYRLIITNTYTSVTSDVAVVTVLFPQPLLNVDFGGSLVSAKTGLAAVGQTDTDFWNGYPAGTPSVSNLFLADGSQSAISMSITNNLFSRWIEYTDPMLHEFIYPPWQGGPFTVRIFGLPAGTYSFYLYNAGMKYWPWYGTDFELIVGGVSQGHNILTGWIEDPPPWREGIDYGTFNNVQVSGPQQSVALVLRGNYGEDPTLAGLQIGQFLTSNAPPVLWSQPASQYVPIGTNFVLTATGSGFPAPAQQWFLNGTQLTNGGRFAGADTKKLAISGADFADSGDYYAVLTNSSGAVTSAVAHVEIGIPPSFTLQPSNQTWVTGQTRSLAAQTTGTAPFSYRWYLGTTLLTESTHRSGTASNILSVSNVVTGDAGTYTLMVSNLFGSTTSTTAVAVVVPPAITAQPAGRSAPVGMPMILTATSSGTTPLAYQWQRFGTNVAGATTNSLNITALTLPDFGDYRLIVSNYGGSVTSDVAQLTVGPVATWGSFGQRTSTPLWPAAGLSNVTAIAGGFGYSMALRADGTVYCWGNSSISNYAVGLTGIVGIAGGYSHALAIRADGTVVAWGQNTYGGTNVPANLSNVVAITAGTYHSVALRADGTVVSWGGMPSQASSNVPPGLIKVAAINAAGFQTLALRESGTVVGWGGTSPVPVPPYLSGAVGIVAGSQASDLNMALLNNGTVTGWSSAGPATNIPPGLTNAIAIDLAGEASDQGITPASGVGLALRSSGTVAAWGTAVGGITNVPPGLSNVVAIAGTPSHALALENDGRPLFLRSPVGGTFHSGTRVTLRPRVLANTPRSFQWFKNGSPIPSATNPNLVLPSAQLSDTANYYLVISNALGVAQSVPVPITIIDSPPVLMSQPASGFAYCNSPFSVGASAVGSGPMQLTWLQNGIVVTNGTDELVFSRALPQHAGDYQLIASNSFGAVASDVAHITFSRVASWGTGPSLTNAPFDLASVLGVASGWFHALAIQSNHTVAAWGTTSNGATNVPPDLTDVVAVSGGNYFSAALRSNGTVTAWGLGSSGQTNVPVGLSNVVAISVGGSHTLALRADGTVAAWGANANNKATVPAGLSNVVAVAAGSDHSLALKNDGRIVAWGLYGTIPNYTNAVAVAAGYGQSLLLQADGRVVGWSTTGKDAAMPAGLTNVVAISAGGGSQGWFHCVALREDGTLVAWGNNNIGQLLIPPDLRSATAISAGGGSTLAYLGDASPTMTVQPWSQSAPSGTNLTLRALVLSQAPATYQWYRNGVLLPGATSNALNLVNTQPAQTGLYQLVAMNQSGSVTSAVASVTIAIPRAQLAASSFTEGDFTFSFDGLSGVLYIVEYKDALVPGDWTELAQRLGAGHVETVTDPALTATGRYYRVRAQYAP